jgi:hypothetical protein
VIVSRRAYSASLSKQRGTTLVVALLFMLLLSLLAASSYNSSTTNSLVTGNMIARQESIASAQWLIDETISSTLFATSPKQVAAGSYELDLNLDGSPDYHPRLDPAPECRRARPLKAVELDAEDEDDVGCMTSGVVHQSGLDTPDLAAATGDSLCANTEWNVRAIVEDELSGAEVAVNQGVGVRVLSTEAMDFCL